MMLATGTVGVVGSGIRCTGRPWGSESNSRCSCHRQPKQARAALTSPAISAHPESSHPVPARAAFLPAAIGSSW